MFVYSHDKRRRVRVDTIVELHKIKLDRPDCYRLDAYLNHLPNKKGSARVILLNEQPSDVVDALMTDIEEAQGNYSG